MTTCFGDPSFLRVFDGVTILLNAAAYCTGSVMFLTQYSGVLSRPGSGRTSPVTVENTMGRFRENNLPFCRFRRQSAYSAPIDCISGE